MKIRNQIHWMLLVGVFASIIALHVAPITGVIFSVIAGVFVGFLTAFGISFFWAGFIYFFAWWILLTTLTGSWRLFFRQKNDDNHHTTSLSEKTNPIQMPVIEKKKYPVITVRTKRGIRGLQILGRRHHKYVVRDLKSGCYFKRTRETLQRLFERQHGVFDSDTLYEVLAGI